MISLCRCLGSGSVICGSQLPRTSLCRCLGTGSVTYGSSMNYEPSVQVSWNRQRDLRILNELWTLCAGVLEPAAWPTDPKWTMNPLCRCLGTGSVTYGSSMNYEPSVQVSWNRQRDLRVLNELWTLCAGVLEPAAWPKDPNDLWPLCAGVLDPAALPTEPSGLRPLCASVLDRTTWPKDPSDLWPLCSGVLDPAAWPTEPSDLWPLSSGVLDRTTWPKDPNDLWSLCAGVLDPAAWPEDPSEL
jgi:hypothetical protein